MSDQPPAEEPCPSIPEEIRQSPFPAPPYHGLHLSLVAFCLVTLLVTFLVFWPVRELLFRPTAKLSTNPRVSRAAFEPDRALTIRVGIVNGLTCLWFFALGASVGSFLNVVLYRVPIGKSIVVGGSGCPHCGHAIRPTDNIPVIGWLRLGGRCRDCRWPIPFRYALVELLFGGLYLGLLLLELHFGALNLPGPRDEWRPFPESLLAVRPLATFLYHLALLHWLVLALLFAWDGNRLPRGVLIFALLVGVVSPLFYPSLVVVDWRGAVQSVPFTLSWLNTALTSLAGFAVGALLAARWWLGRTFAAPYAIGAVLWLVSVYLGWQVGLVAGSVVTVLDLVTSFRHSHPRDFVLLAIGVVVAFALLCFWRLLVTLPGFPDSPLAISSALLLGMNLAPRISLQLPGRDASHPSARIDDSPSPD